MDIKIFQISHVILPEVERHSSFPIFRVGGKSESPPRSDDSSHSLKTCGSIYDLHFLYGELLAHHWVWKNVTSTNYVGFFHYRRYFNFGDQVGDHPKVLLPGRDLCIRNFCTEKQSELAKSILKCFDAITIRAEYSREPMSIRWPSHHGLVAWNALDKILTERYPFLSHRDFFQINKKFVWYPMFVTSWERYTLIAHLLFEILEDVKLELFNPESSVTIDLSFQRILAYLSEPILMLLFHYFKIRSYEAQVIVSEDDRIPSRLTRIPPDLI